MYLTSNDLFTMQWTFIVLGLAIGLVLAWIIGTVWHHVTDRTAQQADQRAIDREAGNDPVSQHIDVRA
jgi:uncharacterized membrane-anchored protein YhcB (DUF1043 family)